MWWSDHPWSSIYLWIGKATQKLWLMTIIWGGYIPNRMQLGWWMSEIIYVPRWARHLTAEGSTWASFWMKRALSLSLGHSTTRPKRQRIELNKDKKIERDFGTQKKYTNIPINIIYNIISDFWSMEVCVFQILARPHGCHPYTWCCLGHAGFDLLGAIQLGLRWWGARSRCTPPPAPAAAFGAASVWWLGDTCFESLLTRPPALQSRVKKNAMHACISWLNTWSSDKGFNQCGSYLDHSAALWSCDGTAPKIQNVSRKDVNVEGPAANII